MQDRIYFFLFCLCVVIECANLLEGLINSTEIIVPDGLIMIISISAFLIFWFVKRKKEKEKFSNRIDVYLSETEREIKNYANLNKDQVRILRKDLTCSKIKTIVIFIFVWILISILSIWFFVEFLTNWHEINWELVGSFLALFIVMGIVMFVMGIIPNLKYSFPNIMKIFESYGLESFEIHKNRKKSKIAKFLNIGNIVASGSFVGKLRNNSFIEYEMEVRPSEEETTYMYYGKGNKKKYTVSIHVLIHMHNVLKNNQFDLKNEDEIKSRFIQYFPVKSIISFSDIQYCNGEFVIDIEKEYGLNTSIEYLVAILRVCQELEDTYNFPTRKSII